MNLAIEQLDLFSFGEFAEPFVQTLTKKSFFKITKGTIVYLDRYCSRKYEVVKDNGEKAVVKRFGGYTDKGEEEIDIDSSDIYAIAEPEFIPLPRDRASDIDLTVYKNKQKEFFESLSEKMKVDMLTYLIAVSGFNRTPDNIMRDLHEHRYPTAIKKALRSMSYGGAYIEMFGTKNTISISDSFVDKTYSVSFFGKYDQQEVYTAKKIMSQYLFMRHRTQTAPVEELNVFELMMYYRSKGLKLRYQVETDEWCVSHPYSSRIMPVKGGREQLNDFEKIAKEYDSFAVINRRKHMIVQSDLFESKLEEVPSTKLQTGFRIPAGTSVSLRGRDPHYRVLNDDGVNAEVILPNVPEAISEFIQSDQIRAAYVGNKFIPIPKLNRPEDLTLEMIYDRERQYYENFTKKEATDMAVLNLTKGTTETTKEKVDRAFYEGNHSKVKELLEGHSAGSSNSIVSYDWNNKNFRFELRTNKPFDLHFTSTEIIKHYNRMVERIETKLPQSLTISELQLAYRLRQYELGYCPKTQEYTIRHSFGTRTVILADSRNQANNIEKTIDSFENNVR